jgi:5-methylcytosine-specific restriction endonuclease McrA
MPKMPPTHKPARPKARTHRPAGGGTTTERWHSDAAYRERSKFYSSQRWQRVRAAVLRGNPLCGWCGLEGRMTPATIVDHIVDLADGGAQTDYANLRALCWGCHSRLTRMKQNGQSLPAIPACSPPHITLG